MKSSLCIAGIAAIVALGNPEAVLSCGYHGVAVGIRATHPRSLLVTFGIQDAYASGRLRPLEPLNTEDGCQRTGRLLGQLARAWAADRDSPFFLREGESISLLLVDQGVWSRIREDQGHLRLTIHVEGPTRGDRVVVTGEAAVLALLERQLTVDHLLNMQVLMIEEPPGKLFNGRLTITN